MPLFKVSIRKRTFNVSCAVQSNWDDQSPNPLFFRFSDTKHHTSPVDPVFALLPPPASISAVSVLFYRQDKRKDLLYDTQKKLLASTLIMCVLEQSLSVWFVSKNDNFSCEVQGKKLCVGLRLKGVFFVNILIPE